MITAAELAAGVAANNARALDPGAWRLRWLLQTVTPTGPFFTVIFEVPEAAALYRLGYMFAWWAVGPGPARPLYVELADDRGQKFTFAQAMQNRTISQGMKTGLFTGPGTDPDPAAAGDQSAYLGAMPLDVEFPGRAQIMINVRGALPTPDPAQVKILLVGHQKNKVGP